MEYTFERYDILQVERNGEWLDFATLRTVMEAQLAAGMVLDGKWEGQTLSFRIVRHQLGKGLVPVFTRASV